jgi:hypothetical protein
MSDREQAGKLARTLLRVPVPWAFVLTYLARSSTSNRQGTVAAKAVFAELSSMYRHCGSEAEINLDTAIGVQPAEHGRISRFERSGHNDRKHSLMGLVAGP